MVLGTVQPDRAFVKALSLRFQNPVPLSWCSHLTDEETEAWGSLEPEGMDFCLLILPVTARKPCWH